MARPTAEPAAILLGRIMAVNRRLRKGSYAWARTAASRCRLQHNPNYHGWAAGGISARQAAGTRMVPRGVGCAARGASPASAACRHAQRHSTSRPTPPVPVPSLKPEA